MTETQVWTVEKTDSSRFYIVEFEINGASTTIKRGYGVTGSSKIDVSSKRITTVEARKEYRKLIAQGYTKTEPYYL